MMRRRWPHVALALVAACSFPTKHFTGGGGGGGGGDGSAGGDARMADGTGGDAGDAGSPFACAGQPFPTTAPQTIMLSGTVESGPNQPIGGVPVQGIDTTTGNQFLTATTDPNGLFGATVMTNGQAIQGYLLTQGQGLTNGPSLYYPRHPFDASEQSLVIYAYTSVMLQQLYSAAGVGYNNNNATVLMTIVDCNGTPVAGATVQSAGNMGMVRYVIGGAPQPGATMTDSTGEVVVLGVPPNNVFTTFNVKGPAGQTFRTYQYAQIPPGSQITAIVQP